MKTVKIPMRFKAIAATLAIGCSLAAPIAPAIASPAPVQPALVTDSVLDTYKSFSTANNPKENISMYSKTYRTLSFKKSYARTGQTVLYTGMTLSPKGNGVVGFESKYKCTYRTW